MNRQEIKHVLTNHHFENMPLREAMEQAERDLVEFEKLLKPCDIIPGEYPEGWCRVHESDSTSYYSDKCSAALGAE